MVSNRYLEIQDAIEWARQRLALIREGLELSDDGTYTSSRPTAKVRLQVQSQSTKQRPAKPIPFHIPAARSYRLSSTTGATSFHFSHRSIGKVTFAMCDEGVRVSPGAARAHGRYVEREEAVASLDRVDELQPHQPASDAPATVLPSFEHQKERDHVYTSEQRIDQWLGRGLVEDLTLSEPGDAEHLFAGPLLGRPIEDALADASMWLLPRRDLVRNGSGAHGVLRSATDVSMEAGSNPLGLRCATQGDQVAGGREDDGFRESVASLRSRNDAPGHNSYITRRGAAAIQPDGSRALLTNIDADDSERARFWSLVEEHEAVNRGDQMTLRVADNTEFWSAISVRDDCPPELKNAIASGASAEPIRFDIASGKAMRAYLETQPGWVPPTSGRRVKDGRVPFAKFHDGRSGRTQFRIVGELPDELGVSRRFDILRDFTEEFAKRGLPFVAVMHAPDHKNDERNWHFHLIYYDRPCRRITDQDIGHLTEQGYRTAHLQPGMWDFAVVTPKKGRSNGRAVPLKQNKVAQVAQDGWIELLREEFAKITNRHLTAAGVERNIDPRRYEEIGIMADPQQHLGTDQAAAETRGVATAVGTENERRQWRAIMAEGDARLEVALRAASQLNDLPHGLDRRNGESTRRGTILAEAARLEHMAFCLEQDIARARSRAAGVQRKNRQLLDAYEADRATGTVRERTEAATLVEAATTYLARLDDTIGDTAALPALARDAAAQARREVAGQSGRQPSTAGEIPVAPIHTDTKRFTTVVQDDAMIAEAMALAKRREHDRQVAAAGEAAAQADRDLARDRAKAPREQRPKPSDGILTGDAARQASMAEALRGQSR